MSGNQWVRIDVGYLRNPKVLAAGTNGTLLHLASILWTSEQQLDGKVPASALQIVINHAGVDRRAVRKVVAAGLWVPTDDGFVVHDFDVLNGSRSPAHDQREQWRIRQQRHRARLNGHGDVT